MRINQKRYRWIIFNFIFLLILVVPKFLIAATVELEWDPNQEPDLAGYRVYYGTLSGDYTFVIDVGNVTCYELSGLIERTTYYFAVTAYDTSSNESDFSNEVSAYIPMPGDLDGDLDGDGDVDRSDYLIFRMTLWKCEGEEGYNADADYDEDGCVSYADYIIWYDYYRSELLS